MFGPSLLIAPIYDESDERTVYLPAGKWINYWTNEVYEGETNIRVHAPLDILPIFVRGGAVIPTMEQTHRIPERLDKLYITVYPHGQCDYTMLEDNDETCFSYREDTESLRLEWNGKTQRRFVLIFRYSWHEMSTIRGSPYESRELLRDALTLQVPPAVQGSISIQRSI
jgi:alpha-glucosidase (family GH31 glycosyl hydrolase)